MTDSPSREPYGAQDGPSTYTYHDLSLSPLSCPFSSATVERSTSSTRRLSSASEPVSALRILDSTERFFHSGVAHDFPSVIGLAIKWLRILLLSPNDKIRNHSIAKPIVSQRHPFASRTRHCFVFRSERDTAGRFFSFFHFSLYAMALKLCL